MGIDLPYGGVTVQLEIDRARVLDIISPSNISPSTQPYVEVERALREPIEGPRIEELAPRDKVIAIAVDDVTRVTPTHILLRSLLKILEKAGAKRTNIRIIVALGSHRRMTDTEMKEKYGAETVENYEVTNHAFDDESQLQYMGKIAEDIPVWINKKYLRARIRIATGNIVPHFNAGWAAGGKILLPGLAGEETVGQMHVRSANTTPNGLGMEENSTRTLIDAEAEEASS